MTKEEIIKLAIEHTISGLKFDEDGLLRFAKLVAEHEREACAEICDGFYLTWINIQGRYELMGEGASECAGAIRARGQE